MYSFGGIFFLYGILYPFQNMSVLFVGAENMFSEFEKVLKENTSASFQMFIGIA